jgi:serine/threonine-protein kinase
MAAHLVLNWERYTGNAESFDSVAQEIVAFVGSDVRGRVVRRWVLTWLTILPRLLRRQRYTITNLLQGEYRRLYKNAKLKDLGGGSADNARRPEIYINCTSLNTGAPCRFGRYGFSWYEGDVEKKIAAPETDVSLAVAASSAFPPLFPPVTVSHETLYCDRKQFPTPLQLTDGGVFDNLGIDQLVWRQKDGAAQDDLFLLSDAEGTFDWDLDRKYKFFTARNIRASALIMKRVSDLEYASYDEAPGSMVPFKIDTEVPGHNDQSALAPEIQRSLCKIRTDLDLFTPYEINCLVQHGAAVAQQTAERYLQVGNVCRSPWRPAPDDSLVPKLLSIRRASSRRLRIWSYKDWASWVTLSVVAVALLLVGYFSPGVGWLTSSSKGQQFMRFDLDAGRDFESPVVSPDGTLVAFVSTKGDKGGIFVRGVNQARPRLLPDTEGAIFPFFSPDGKWLAFTAGGKLKKVRLDGAGPQVTLCDAPNGRGGSWGTDGYIVIARSIAGGLSRVPADGGVPEELTRLGPENGGGDSHRWPQTLPGGGVLFAATTQGVHGSLRLLPPGSDNSVQLVPNSTYGRYYNGHLIYFQNGALFAAELDLDRMKLKSSPFPLIYEVGYDHVVGLAQFDISESGTLVYRSQMEEKKEVSLIDDKGAVTPLPLERGDYVTPKFSPDGRQLALASRSKGRQNMLVFDLDARGGGRPLTFDAGPCNYPVWTPDGEYIAYSGASTLSWTHARGGGEIKELAEANRSPYPWSFSPDGKLLAFTQGEPSGGWQVWTTRADNSQGGLRFEPPQRLDLGAQGAKSAPAISPDGRWLAYASDETERKEIYITSFLELRGKWLVSDGGGQWPIFTHNGRLFYLNLARQIVVVEYEVKDDRFVKKSQRMWSDKPLAVADFLAPFDVSQDGARVVGLYDVVSEDKKEETNIRVVLDVDSALRSKQSPPP